MKDAPTGLRVEEADELAESDDDPTATHMPVLIGLARLMIVKRVVELGAGQYSTPLFLNRAAYPHLAELRSYENNGEWVDRVRELADDARLRLTPVSGPMHPVVKGIDLSAFDLVFVDDSVTVPARVKTILKVARNYHGAGVVVIHDYERPVNRRAARALKNHFAFTALIPNTGVCWNHPGINANDFEELNALIKRHAARIRPDDVGGWLRAIRRGG